MIDSSLKMGDYTILGKIAHGGMAEIFKAKTSDVHGIERLVVIKRILPHISSHPEYIDMLIDEAKIAVHFTHGNIAQIYDLGKVANDYFIVMEYVDGKTLAQILRAFRNKTEAISVPLIIYCLIEVCKALDYIHYKTDSNGAPLGVIHRDVSPQNIIISYSGTVKVIDFGVAKSLERLSHTESGVLKGKFAYMSPEQIRVKKIDKRSDLFAVGVLLWELLTQTRLFKRGTNKETIKAVLKYCPDSPSTYRTDVPKELDQIVFKALQKKRWRRYQSAQEMAEDLGHFLMKHYPDFRPLHVTQFLYSHFGPEADEEGLPLEIPHVVHPDVKTKKVGVFKYDEKTKLGFINKISQWFFLPSLKKALMGFIIAILLGIVAGYVIIPKTGTILVYVNPTEATLKLDGTKLLWHPQGTYRWEGNAKQTITLKASLNGYFEKELSEQIKRGKEQIIHIKLEKKPLLYTDLYIDSWPAGAMIMLNDTEWLQNTPARIPRLEVKKRYKIRLAKENYQAQEKDVQLQAIDENRLHFVLNLDYASLEIATTPAGALVYHEGILLGQTPYVNERLTPDERLTLELVLTGYETIRLNETFLAGEKKKLSFELKKL